MTLQSVQYHAANAANYAHQCLPTPNQLAVGVHRVAIPAITLAAFSMIQGAEAIKFTECIDNCNSHRDAHPLAQLLCYAACAIFAE